MTRTPLIAATVLACVAFFGVALAEVPTDANDVKPLLPGLKAPAFTRPREWRGLQVPEALLSGDHKRIENFNQVVGTWKTLQRRPDLMNQLPPIKSKVAKAIFSELKDRDFEALDLDKEEVLKWNEEWKWW